jgi:hypothetical protein
MESRISVLISAYADRAPVEVDPMAMTRLAAAGRGGSRPHRIEFGTPGVMIGVALLLLAILVSIVGGAVGGVRPFLREPEDVLSERAFVEPFRGVAPTGTVPSTPEAGGLVLSFNARLSGRLDGDHFRMWLFADGRLIWKSDLEGVGRANPAFGATPPTTAVIEQRLTPEGVSLMLSQVLASARVLGPAQNDEAGGGIAARPGVQWGVIALGGEGGRLSEATWTDPRLPLRLADPSSWLPPSAWADARIGGFVPTGYAMCARDDGLPEAVRAMVMTYGTETNGTELTGRPWQPDGCHLVPLDVARQIVEALDAAGLKSYISFGFLHYNDPTRVGELLRFLPVLPHGEVVCNCG